MKLDVAMPEPAKLPAPNRSQPAFPKGAMSSFRLGLFGDTRSGKTTFLTTLFAASDDGQLPAGMSLRPSPGNSLRRLHELVAMVKGGRWPPGNVETDPIDLVLDYGGRTYSLHTKDFKGGDFGDLAETTNRAEFSRFVEDLFHGCNAYVFLIDPGVLKAPDEPHCSAQDRTEFEHIRLRMVSAVLTSLEMLRSSRRTSVLFHHPTAIVFSKCDLHRDVVEDPKAFADKYMSPICRYLETHARTRHAFFAVSSTGPIADPSQPPAILKPEGLVEPLKWCIAQDYQRRRVIRNCAWLSALFAVLILSCTTYFHNARYLQSIRDGLSTSDESRLSELWRDVRTSIWLLPTHWDEKERVAQEVVAEARRRFDDAVAKNLDGNGVLREVDFYVDAESRISDFRRLYPGTAAAGDLQTWLQFQRSQLANRLVGELDQLAQKGNESAFAEKLKQYEKVATKGTDELLVEAEKRLDDKTVHDWVARLFTKRGAVGSDVDSVLAACNEAEQRVYEKKLDEKDLKVQYLRKVRLLYNDLKHGGTTRAINFVIRDKTGNNWKCRVQLEGVKEWVIGDWSTPPKGNDGFFSLSTSGTQIDINLLGDANRNLKLYLEEDTWGSNGVGTWEKKLRTINVGDGQYESFETDEHSRFEVTVRGDGGIAEFFRGLTDIERLEDELFR